MSFMVSTMYKVLGFEDKAPWKSVTVWGSVIWAVGDFAVTTVCGTPELTFGGELIASSAACGAADTFVEKFGAVLAALGVRKAKKNA